MTSGGGECRAAIAVRRSPVPSHDGGPMRLSPYGPGSADGVVQVVGTGQHERMETPRQHGMHIARSAGMDSVLFWGAFMV